jgi:hypothetical protein
VTHALSMWFLYDPLFPISKRLDNKFIMFRHFPLQRIRWGLSHTRSILCRVAGSPGPGDLFKPI